MLPIPDTLNSGRRPPAPRMQSVWNGKHYRIQGVWGANAPQYSGRLGGEAPQDSGGSGGAKPPRVLLNLFPPQSLQTLGFDHGPSLVEGLNVCLLRRFGREGYQ